ncbi:boi-related E3 ubiquitin-protein ligase 1, partial [Phtheirospermum japonicum]
ALHHTAEEKAAKALREKELELEAKFARTIELEKMVDDYKAEAEWLRGEVDYLERTKKTLRDMNKARRYADYAAGVEDDAESSYVDSGRAEPVRLACKVCDRRLATVLVWPCRHACVCTGCDAAVRVCPICGARKTWSIELKF